MSFLTDIASDAKEKNVRNIYIFAHKRHDGDAKGAALALREYFLSLGFSSRYIITEKDYCYLGILEEVYTSWDVNGKFFAIILDTPKLTQCDNQLYRSAQVIYKIDHHEIVEEFEGKSYIDSKASSTCEIIASMLGDKEITPKIATYLYTGIYTDTGKFEYKLRPETLKQAGRLLELGADYDKIVANLKYMSSYRKKCDGIISYNHKTFGKDVIGCIVKSGKYNFGAKDLSRSINILKDVKAKVYFCACEDENGKMYVQVRSSQDTKINVGEIMQKYGSVGSFHAGSCELSESHKINRLIDDLKYAVAKSELE